jgi:peptidoglycan/xylan/chitin deacetylase (PgdA/CDA1 family)
MLLISHIHSGNKMNFIFLIQCFTLLFFLWYGLPHLLKKWQIASLRKRCRKSRVIVLTYDDGPGEMLTPTLLKVLESYNVRANFFMVGHKVNSFTNQAREVISKGHIVGSHSFRHLHAWKSNPYAVNRDIQAGFQKCKQISSSNLFRPPFGKITLATLLLTWISHKELAWWTIDSSDTWATSLPIEKIIDQLTNEGGGVVLMHDYDRNNSSKRDFVIDLTNRLIQFARDEDFKIITLQDMPFN